MKTKKLNKPILERFNLSYSSYSVWKKSQLQFYYQYLSDVKTSDKVNQSYGIVGNVIHKANEVYIEKNGEDIFDELWKDKEVNKLRGFNDKKFNKEEHRKYFEKFKALIDELKKNKSSYFVVEKSINFKSKELYGITVKGFIDLLIENYPKLFIYDWKTNTWYDKDMHKDQRLFYSYLLYKELGKIPNNCAWLYIKGGYMFHCDTFVESDMIKFENELKKMLDDIKAYGDDISRYSIGDYDNPFNAYKSLCIDEEKARMS